MKPLLKRPFAFWFPAFGLLFLLWSWVDSCHHNTTGFIGYNGNTSAGSCSFTLRASWFAFSLAHDSGDRRPGRLPIEARTERHEIPPSSATWWFPLPYAQYEHDAGRIRGTTGATYEYTIRSFALPHWCLVPAYLALWWAALRWHHRRVNRLRQAAATPSPAQPQTDL